ncbi:MEDS domain-containing protein [Planococcus versutus]|uniref:3-ketoacyl-ACP reductase n=1 Tax=Planococcus versutus TaxID=1302659 RepID=A0A1B1RYZ1_9BACL|nr:MEDS domain-containing protein [Planococcus versutus]ANU26151.1 3-ketoacyl-ACP reductase [Planococcus versutus]
MEKEIIAIQDKQQLSKGDHIFYYVEDLTSYIDNAISYVEEGIKQGDQVLFVENERLFPKIVARLEEFLSEEQLQNIHYVNNFTFYWRNGNFHPPTILKHFSSLIDPLVEKELSFRTWGHIEWRDNDELTKELNEYEQAINELIPQIQAISVCAYDASRLTVSLKELLINCHDFLMTDGEISPLAK